MRNKIKLGENFVYIKCNPGIKFQNPDSDSDQDCDPYKKNCGTKQNLINTFII